MNAVLGCHEIGVDYRGTVNKIHSTPLKKPVPFVEIPGGGGGGGGELVLVFHNGPVNAMGLLLHRRLLW